MRLPLKRLRLLAPWALVPVVLLLAHPTPALLTTGALITAPGALLRGWAAGTIRKNVLLTTGGPYAYTRNPLYLGTFLIGLGLVVAAGEPWLFGIYLPIFALIYGVTMRREAHNLEQRFGEEYRAYAAQVPLFLPRLRAPRLAGTRTTGFQLEQYLWRREYRTVIGALLGFLALLARMYWR